MAEEQAVALDPVSMEEAVGYPAVECAHQTPVEEPLVLKHDRLFLLADSHGDIEPAGNCGLGLFHDDTRILSRYRLRFAGGSPSLLSAQAARMYGAQIDLAIDDERFGGTHWESSNGLHVRRELVLGDRLTERTTVTNYFRFAVDFWVELSFGCDFADLFEVRGWKREERGQFFAPQVNEDAVVFAYRGRGGELIRSAVCFASPPDELEASRALWRFRLEPQEEHRIEWDVLADPERQLGRGRYSLPEQRGRLGEVYEEWTGQCSRWETDVEEFNAALLQAEFDLRALYIRADGGDIVSAGIPWYSTAFGRDSIITSLQTLALNPRVAIDTLRYLARHQGEKEDSFTEEQPGKIMHELRRGEMARAGEIPHVPYYGTIDATPLWLVLLDETWRWTGDRELVEELLPHAERALQWIDRYGDLDGDGLVEYHRTSEKGLANQGWKDSWNGVPFPDGELPEGPIALVEVQGYVHDAKRRMAALLNDFGRHEAAEALLRDAAALRERILHRFWMEELGTFALALDGEKRPLPTVTTNAGHLLWSRVPDPEHARRMAEVLLSPEMFSGWGLRTLSSSHTVYNPMSYHNGTVWPHDNALVVLGLSLYGQVQGALPVVSAMHDAAAGMRYHRLPELFCGMERAHGRVPVQYPVSCSPQAWASGAFFMMLQALTGFEADAPRGILHIRQPRLPDFLRELTVSALRIGQSEVSLRFMRERGRTMANLLEVRGAPLQVRIELS